MKSLSFLFYFLLAQDIFLMPATGIVYYVKSTSPNTTNCTGQPCQTLQYYFDNVNTTINNQKNVTMIFMDGNHHVVLEYVEVTVPVMSMKGESQGVFLDCGFMRLNFNNFTEVDLSNIMIELSELVVLNTNTLQTSRFSMSSVTSYQSQLLISTINTSFRFDSCEFQDSFLSIDVGKASVSIENCTLTESPLSAQYSNVVFSGISHLTGTKSSAIFSYFNNITLSGAVTFANNSGIRGGAMALYSSMLYVTPGTNVSFINNLAEETGGAIYINPNLIPDQLSLILVQDIFPEMANEDIRPQCFYQLLNCSVGVSYTFSFANNSAMHGGDDIYGASLQFHQSSGNCNLTVNFRNNSGMSSVSSEPTRVCLCDSKGTPQCKNNSYMLKNYAVHPGEKFTISAIMVGGDFGATRGSIYANFFLSFFDPSPPSLTSTLQYSQAIDNVTHCSKLNYSLHYSENETPIMYLTTAYIGTRVLNAEYGFECRDESCLYTTPVYLSITLLPCPPGFTLLGEQPVCDCYPVLTDSNVECDINNGRGMFSWNGGKWINISIDGNISSIIYTQYCPVDYCDAKSKHIDLIDNSDSQCAFNRAGRLCGGCKENYSLAIGSSHCIHCPNNNNLALLIFFAAAGFLLVFFISAFNLTVTQGMINGLIFYANIVWAHQGLLFPQQTGASAAALTSIAVGRTFIAWLNLDFGIQTCFFDGLNAFWKTWLQYLFPFYTAGLFFIGLRYSSKLSKLFGSRSVPTLATLLFLSYTKLLRTIITSLELSRLTKYPNDTSYYIWSIDGRLKYGQFPHITLLLMAIGCLLILWLPYTLLLLLMQWLRRIQNFTVSKWITRYKPVFDAYFAPLKDKHHYWFGVLLLSRGVLLLISSLTANINPAVSPFLLLSVATLLLCHINYNQVYKRKSVLILESAFLMNLIILTGGAMYYRDSNSSEKATLICLSIGIAFIKFCGIVIWSILQAFPSRCLHCQPHRSQFENIEPDNESTQLFQEREIIQNDDQFRDSIQKDSQIRPTY